MNKDKSISKELFKIKFRKGNSGYIKKPNSWKRTHLWWEPMDNNELWFINIASDIRTKGKDPKIEESVWLNANRLDSCINIWANEGYKFYLNE